MDDAPSFKEFLKRVQEAVIFRGITPLAVGDGLHVGRSSPLNPDAMRQIPVELWPQADVEEFASLAEIACLPHNAEALNLRFEPLPRTVETRLKALIESGRADPQWGPPSSRRGPDLQADFALEGEPPASSSEATAVQLPSTPAASGGTRTPQYTIAPRAALPPKPPPVSTRSIADNTAVAEVQGRCAGTFFNHHHMYPRLVAHLTGGGRPASLDLLHPTVCYALYRRLEGQQAVHDVVCDALRAAGSPSCLAALNSISGRAADGTFMLALEAGIAKDAFSPLDVLFGIVPVGDFALVALLSVFVPAPSDAGKKLIAFAQSASFFDKSGKFNVANFSGRLLAAVADAGEDAESNDYDRIMRFFIGAMAKAHHAQFSCEEHGVTYDWKKTASKWVNMIVDKGAGRFTAADFSTFKVEIALLGRLQGILDTKLQAALSASGCGGGGEPSGSVLQLADDSPDADFADVQAFGLETPLCLGQCGHGVRGGHALCVRCGAVQGDAWLCSVCRMLTLDSKDTCSFAHTGGCPGTKAQSRKANGGDIKNLAKTLLQARSAHRPRPSGQGAGGRAVGGAQLVPLDGGAQPVHAVPAPDQLGLVVFGRSSN